MTAKRSIGVASGMVLATLLFGCADADVSRLMVKPGKYSVYSCEQIAMTGSSYARREQELQALIDKAAQGPGGELAIAIGYRNEFLSTQGHLRELEAAASAKNCPMAWRTPPKAAAQ